MLHAWKKSDELPERDLSYQDYRVLAQRLAAERGIPVTPANEAGSVRGTGIFQNRHLRPRISFTPYIHNRCSAECVFCSERLSRKKAMPTRLRYSPIYEEKLRAILEDLRTVRIFLSLSGMEPLESLAVVEQNLAVFADFERSGGQMADRVIYSNLSRAVSDPEAVLALLHTYPVTRIETSRHHFDTEINASIMRFRPKYRARETSAYEEAVRMLGRHVLLEMACVLQKRGIATFPDIIAYIEWARGMNVKAVSFRELAILGEVVTGGDSFEYITRNRQRIYPLLETMPAAFTLQSVVQGYYYFSFQFRYEDSIDVTFSVSDYDVMTRCHESSTINKLIYYPDASLCTDWNLQGRIY